jgi:Na+-driven multidrug efflux pump
MRLGLGFLFGIVLGGGLFGVWLGWAADFICRATLVTLRYRSGRWKYLRV